MSGQIIAYAALVFGVGFCIGGIIGRWRALYVTFGLGGILLAVAVFGPGANGEDTPAMAAFFVGCVVTPIAAAGTAAGVAARERARRRSLDG